MNIAEMAAKLGIPEAELINSVLESSAEVSFAKDGMFNTAVDDPEPIRDSFSRDFRFWCGWDRRLRARNSFVGREPECALPFTKEETDQLIEAGLVIPRMLIFDAGTF